MSRKDKIYLSILALLPLFVFYPMYTSDKLIAWLDMIFYFMPFRTLTAELIQKGVMPFWNQYLYCGTPLLANMQSAVFYPLNIFFHVLPADMAVRITTFLAFTAMSLFMYSYLRLYNISQEASFASSAVFSFGFYTAVKAVEMAEFHVLAWLPAVLYFTKKYAEQGKSYDRLLIPFMLCLSLLGGHLQFFAYGYLLFTAVFIFENIYLKQGERLQGIKDFVMINVIFGLISAVQLVPTVLYILDSNRAAGGVSFAENTGGFMRFEHLASFFLPFLSTYFSRHMTFLNWIGLVDTGILPILLVILAAWKSRDVKLKDFLLLILVLSLFFAFLSSMPFYKSLYEHAGLLSSIRYPSKVILLGLFAICFLAALGFDELFTERPERLNRFAAFTAALAAVVFAAYIFMDAYQNLIIKTYRDMFDPLMKFQGLYDTADAYSGIMKGFLIYALLFCAAAFLVYLIAVKETRAAYMKAITVVFIIINLFAFNKGWYELYVPPDWMTMKTGQVNFLVKKGGEKPIRVLAPGINNTFQFSVDYKTDRDLYYYNIDALVPNVPMTNRIKNADGFDSLLIGDFSSFKRRIAGKDAPWEHPAFSLFSADYIVSKSEIRSKNLKLASSGYCYIYENSNVVDFAFFVPASAGAVFAEGNAAQDILFNKDFSVKKNLVLDRASMAYIKPLLQVRGGGKTTAPARIEVTSPDINSYSVLVRTTEPGFLVLADNYFPGWAVYVDSKKERLLKAYTLYKSVYLAPGEHKVLFRYTPAGFVVSAVISIIMLLLLIPVVPALLMLF